MMNPLRMMSDAGPSAYLVLGLAMLGTLVVAASGVAWARGREFPPVAALFPIFVAALLSVQAGASGTAMSMEAVAHASAEMKQTLIAAGIYVGMMNTILASWFLLMPLSLLFVVAAGVGARGEERRRVLPAVAGALSAVTLGLLVVSTVQVGTGWGGTALAGLASLLVVLGLMGDGPESVAPVAGAAGALAFPFFIALTVAGNTAGGLMEVFDATAHASAAVKSQIQADGLQHVLSGRGFGLSATLSAAGVAAAGCLGALKPSSPGRGAGVFAGFALVVAGLATVLMDTSAALELMRMEWR